MAKETEGLTPEWAIEMEECGYATTEDAADLLEELSRAQTALFLHDNPRPLCGIVKQYHESEKTDGSNFRTHFGMMLVFAREVDPELEESILNMFSHGLIAYTQSVSWDWDQASVNEYTGNAYLALREVVQADVAGRDLDLEF